MLSGVGAFNGLLQGKESSSGEESEAPLDDADNHFHYKTITSLMQRMAEGSSKQQAAIRDHFLATNAADREIFLALRTTTEILQSNAQQQKDVLDLLATYNGMPPPPTHGVNRHNETPPNHTLDSFRAAEDIKKSETPESNELRNKYNRKIQDHIAFLLGMKRGEIATVTRKVSPEAIKSVNSGKRAPGLDKWCLDWESDAKSRYNTMAIQVAARNFVDLAKTSLEKLPKYATDVDNVFKSMQQHVQHLLLSRKEKGSLYAVINAEKPGSSLIPGPPALLLPTLKPPTSSSTAGLSTSKTLTSSALTATPRNSQLFTSPFSMNQPSPTAESPIPGPSVIKPSSKTEVSTGAQDVILQHISHKKLLARRTRKRTLARQRRELVASTDLLQHHSAMMERLGTDATSSDESEPEYFTNELAIERGRTKRLRTNQPGPDRKKNHYTVVQPAWRSFQLSKFLWRLDELRQESRAKVDGPIVRMPRGNPPRIRIRTSETHEKKAPKGLPCNFYDPAWLKSMNSATRGLTVGKMQDAYALTIPGDPPTEGDDGYIKIWSTSNLQLIQSIRTSQGAVVVLCWVPRNQVAHRSYFLSAGSDATVKLWRETNAGYVEDSALTAPDFETAIEDMAIFGSTVALACNSKFALLTVGENPPLLHDVTISRSQRGHLRSLIFLEAGTQLLIGFLDSRELELWSLATTPPSQIWSHRINSRRM
ncbi:hypothetical protein BDN72DRAFT_903591 [Pluteus cervinus]|uniref:Uncharacterized protein n=1 Tax=Pluteus cervinus TaxID=181527 RepID=A0ACD3A8M8_9AGAR|nr:hypothetical protein BDN72DRAFT_903591 [Pluteus cervinus]